MKHTVATFLLSAITLAACATAPTPPPSAQTETCAPVISGAEVDEIRRLERVGAASNVEGWGLDDARAFFAPEWTSVQPNGSVMRLDAVLSQFPNGRSQPWASRFELPELDVRVYCDVAVVVGVGEAWAPDAAANATPAVRFRFTNVWRKQDGRWLYAANQFTRY